ncbi:MAG: DJ-1/PfpI family protein [Cyanobacteria bacterium P01_E01_bin.42]
MTYKVLEGKKVAILTETEFIPHELDYYEIGFKVLGASVDFMTNMNGAESRTIVSDVDSPETKLYYREVYKDPKDYNANDYDIVLMSANYCSVRLREIPPMGSLGSIEELQTPPAVQFFKEAMLNKNIVKGALCHGLWILTPCPEILMGRRVICHTVVLADIHNAGAIYVPEPSHIVIDEDLVTGRSAADLEAYFDAIVATAIA